MAYTVQLSDGTNTVNLIDGTTYQVLPNGIQHGPPSPRRAMSPESLLEDGSDLIEERFSNRRVTLRLHIMGATKDALIQGVRDIQALLETPQIALAMLQSFASMVRSADNWASYSISGVSPARQRAGVKSFRL
ncbi:MAG: hypothetical protein IIC82_01140 [Chloroflexi bacterium]|nr:hypothetical protein [Chloroflexota bacterium]